MAETILYSAPQEDLDGVDIYVYLPSLTARAQGHIEVHWDKDVAAAGGFWCYDTVPAGTAYRLIDAAVAAIPEDIPGVIIHVDEMNRARKMYKRLGFEQTNIPGIMTANMETVRRHLSRWRSCARKKDKV